MAVFKINEKTYKAKPFTYNLVSELEEMGIEEGDTVRMYGLQFDYYK